MLICRPNHRLGNLILITPLIQEVIATFPGCKIDLLVKGEMAPTLFKYYENIDRIIQLPSKPVKYLIESAVGWISILSRRYDLVINAVHNSSSGKLASKLAKSRLKVFGNEIGDAATIGEPHIAKYPVLNLRHVLSSHGISRDSESVPLIDIKLSPIEAEAGKKIVSGIFQNDRKTISIYTYATARKCYSKAWWESFHEKLKCAYPDFNILEILPLNNTSQLGFATPTFYSQDVREIGAVISNTAVFIGADCGIMHLASAAHAPTVGLFSVTNESVYAPYGNKSISFNTNSVTISQVFEHLESLILKPLRPAVNQHQVPVIPMSQLR